jgi:hypothetical protein
MVANNCRVSSVDPEARWCQADLSKVEYLDAKREDMEEDRGSYVAV